MRRRLIALRQYLDSLGLGRDWALIVYGAIIGSVTAVGAVLFALALHWTEHNAGVLQGTWPVFLLPLLPMVGALITGVLVSGLAGEARGHGVPQVIDALVRRGGRIPLRVGIVKIVASIATVGSGGSAGAEGPIVQIGSTAGSALGRGLRANQMDMGTLVGCGAAAGIASIFNAPIAGVFFALEVLLRDFSLRTFTPIIVAAVFSTAVTQVLLERNEAIFAVGLVGYEFSIAEIPSFIVLGFICALLSIAFTRALHRAEDSFERIRINPMLLPVIGAALLGILGIGWVLLTQYFGATARVPAFFGNGYETIRWVIDPATYDPEMRPPGVTGILSRADMPGLPLLIWILLLLAVFKTLATCFTLGSGGSGGVFAPSLFVGATAGAAFGMILERLSLMPDGGSPASYALVGMAAVVAGTTFAPLTAILLLFELTGEAHVLLPVMLASIIAAVGGRLWMRESIYTMKLRAQGILLGSGRDLTVMRRLAVTSVEMTPLPSEPIYPSDPLSKLIALHMPRTAPDFVVVDAQGHYVGMVTGDDLRTALVDREAIPLLLVAELVRDDFPPIQPHETLDTVLDKFARHDVASLPLMDATEPTKPIGLITRANVIRRYHAGLEAG